MKRLLLLRHAKTERESPDGGDFERRLTTDGRADAARIGRAIADRGIGFDLAYGSPARRAVETVDLARLSVRLEPKIYNASTEQLLALVRAVDPAATGLLMVGHNPGFEMLLAMLAGARPDMPTGSLAEIGLAVDQWAEVTAGSGRLVQFLKPTDIA